MQQIVYYFVKITDNREGCAVVVMCQVTIFTAVSTTSAVYSHPAEAAADSDSHLQIAETRDSNSHRNSTDTTEQTTASSYCAVLHYFASLCFIVF